MLSMITPRINPSAFFRHQPATDLFVQEHRQAKLGRYVVNLAAPRHGVRTGLAVLGTKR